MVTTCLQHTPLASEVGGSEMVEWGKRVWGGKEVRVTAHKNGKHPPVMHRLPRNCLFTILQAKGFSTL